MPPKPEKQILHQATKMLADLVGVPAANLQLETHHRAPGADAIVRVGPLTFVLEAKGSGAAGSIALAIEQVSRYATAIGSRAIPLIVVPYMGEVGRRRCEAAGVAWLDLSGNAHIVAPRLRILIDGRPNRFKRPGRPSSVFAPMSARIVRWLLIHPDHPMTQRQIAQATNMDKGFTSRIIARLEADGLVLRAAKGTVRLRDAELLLEAWRESYDFSKHQIIRGHIPARSGTALLEQVTTTLRTCQQSYAATGLAAAWLLTHFASFRLVTIYLPHPPEAALKEQLGFREESQGANVWLIVPNDEGVFQGATEQNGISCVHPVQVYLDLKHLPERAPEASERLRSSHLKLNTHA